jgi:hypothetical protein
MFKFNQYQALLLLSSMTLNYTTLSGSKIYNAISLSGNNRTVLGLVVNYNTAIRERSKILVGKLK